MPDVRLTATNPEDSSVVPVACNERGELMLEEIPDQSFDGNLDGDLSVSGDATFAGDNTLTNGFTAYKTPAASNGGQIGYDDTTKALRLYSNSSTGASAKTEFYFNKSATPDITFDQDGTAKFGVVRSGETNGASTTAGGVTLNDGGGIFTQYPSSVTASTAVGLRILHGANHSTTLYADGSCQFAGNKAGFTAEGYLWCTTRRGDTVILDGTSNGMGIWEFYTPPSRREEIKDAWSEKNAIDTTDVKFPSDPPEKPADTQ